MEPVATLGCNGQNMDSVGNTAHSDFFPLFRSQNKQETEATATKEHLDDDLAPSPYADNYKMNHTRRGTVLIFNHVKFSMPECPTREGSDKDRDALTDVFHELDFDVLAHNDLTAHEIISTLATVSQMDHTDSDCFVVVVMSHGDNCKLYARDRDYPTKKLWAYFNARSCPSLAGKPKLFFIQACRGSGLHPSQLLRYSTLAEDHESSDDAFYTIPVMADILVMYSTVEGFYSWRDPKEGGYFIQSLVNQLRRHNKSKDLLTILTFVNREVAVDFTSYEQAAELCGRKQMCSIVSMLTRLVYFTNEHKK